MTTAVSLARASLCSIFFIAITFLMGVGCGGDAFDGDDDVGVIRVRADDEVVRVGDETVIRIRFEFSSDDVFNDDDDVFLVVRLPREVTFRNDSSEIQSFFGDEDVDAIVTRCDDTGETFLSYRLDDNDLDRAEDPSGDADAELAFTVDAVMTGDDEVISAAANDNPIAFDCGSFIPDASELLTVVEGELG